MLSTCSIFFFFSKNKLVGTQKPLPRQSLHIPGDNDDHSVAPLEFTIIYLGFYIKKDREKNWTCQSILICETTTTSFFEDIDDKNPLRTVWRIRILDNQSGFLSSLRNWKIYQGSNNKSGFVIYQISKTLYKTDYKSKRDARGLSEEKLNWKFLFIRF